MSRSKDSLRMLNMNKLYQEPTKNLIKYMKKRGSLFSVFPIVNPDGSPVGELSPNSPPTTYRPVNQEEMTFSDAITWELVFSKSSFKCDEWLRNSAYNLNSICDPRNAFVQKLISRLFPPDMIINLLRSDKPGINYKALVLQILSKTHLRRFGKILLLLLLLYIHIITIVVLIIIVDNIASILNIITNGH